MLSSCCECWKGETSIRGQPVDDHQDGPLCTRVSPLPRASASQPGRCGAASTRAEVSGGGSEPSRPAGSVGDRRSVSWQLTGSGPWEGETGQATSEVTGSGPWAGQTGQATSEVTGSVGRSSKDHATSLVRKGLPKCMGPLFNARVEPLSTL